jgi:hypothetical protein
MIGSAVEADRAPRPGAAAAFGHYFHTFVFGAYPVLIVVGSSAGVLPLDSAAIGRALAVAFTITAALLLVMTPIIRDLSNRTAWLTFVFIAFNLYAVVGGTSAAAGVAAAYVLGSAVVATLIVRPWKSRARTSTPLNLAACTVLAANLYGSAGALRQGEPWRPSADALIAQVATSGKPMAGDNAPDIYHIILDGFGRPDVLAEMYSLDLEPFVRALEARGFAIPAASRSNYAQTYLSLASSLNLSYLDPVATVAPDSGDRRGLDYLIQHNALMALGKRSGYRVVAIGSNYSATERLSSADVCLCEQHGLHEIDAAAINLTPLRALPLERWTFGAHRRKITQAFEHVERVSGETGRKMVFAHLISPHPPFVFEADGRPRTTVARMYTFEDGSHFRGASGEYVAGYREQARYVAGRVLALVDVILSRPGPPPVIVVHGDHGPGSDWNWEDVSRANARERLAILSAYRFPGAQQAFDPGTTPVNGLRLMANRYLGTTLPALPDRSFASTWRQPFQLVAIDATAPAPERTAARVPEAGNK